MRAKALLSQSQSSHTTHVLFIINLPVQVAQSSFVGFQGHPWVSCHIDELRPGEKGAITLEGAQGVAVSELFYGGLERKSLQYERQESDFTRNVEGMVFEHMISTENEENWEQEEEEHEEVEEQTTYKEKIEEMMVIDIEGGEEEDEMGEEVDKEEIEEEENMEEEAAETGSEENGKGETKEAGSEVSSEEEQEKTGSEVSSEEEQEKTGSEVNEKTGEDEARSEKISEEEESENSEVEQDMKETEDREKSGDMQVEDIEDDLSSSYSTQTPEEHMDDKEKVRNSPNDVEITASVNTMSQRMKTYSDMYKQCVRLNSCIQAAASRLQDSNKQRATERVHLLINIIPRKPIFPLGTYNNILASIPGLPCLCVYCARYQLCVCDLAEIVVVCIIYT